MNKFAIRTRSKFEHIYFVEAETLAEAIDKVETGLADEGMQKFIDETVYGSLDMADGSLIDRLRTAEYA